MFPPMPGALSLDRFISWALNYNSKYTCSWVTLKAQANCGSVQGTGISL